MHVADRYLQQQIKKKDWKEDKTEQEAKLWPAEDPQMQILHQYILKWPQGAIFWKYAELGLLSCFTYIAQQQAMVLKPKQRSQPT